jgi:hypothetical protein
MKAALAIILSLFVMTSCQIKRFFGRSKRNNGSKSYRKSPTMEYASYSPASTTSSTYSSYPSQLTQNTSQYSSIYSSSSPTYSS